MKTLASSLAAIAILATSAPGTVVISQYVETNSGVAPKGLELWNTGSATIDFSTDNLVVEKGANGKPPATDFTLTAGTIAPGEVIVIGTSDMGTYLDDTFGDGSAGSSTVQYFSKAFSFNGDDSLVVTVGGVTQDVFGEPGVDPGSSWTGNGVDTRNQNIALLAGITDGDIVGWTDPSIRFATVSTDPVGAGGLDGFGVAPVPESASFLLGALGLLTLLRRRRSHGC